MNKEVNKYTLAVFLQTIGSGMVMTYMNLFMTDYLLITAAMVSTALLIAKFIDLFVSLNEQGRTIVMVTHDPEIAGRANKVYHMGDGKLIEMSQYQSGIH